MPCPLVLIILDGWGYRAETTHNAIAAAYKPNWDYFNQHYFHTLISGSGRCVGLPEGQMGNSEVGHLNMGAGRIVHQDLTRIDVAIESGEFFKNEVLLTAINKAKEKQRNIHILGLLSPGGVHSHETHIYAMTQFAMESGRPVFIHAFLDGRDTPPRSAMSSIRKLDALCQTQATSRIASIIGRYYAMDRDKRWDRIQKAYDLLVEDEAALTAPTAEEGLALAYARGETDEFVQATRIQKSSEPSGRIQDGDVVVFMNFRADRARELTQSLTDPNFTHFQRKNWPILSEFVCISEYDSRYKLPTAYPPESLKNIFAAYISEKGLKQLRIAETEKYAHVTFFFNGGIEEPHAHEERLLIPSPQVATYDLQPEMNAPLLTNELVKAILSKKFDVIICNYANPDMVGHTGNFEATVKAIETIDGCLGKIFAAIKEVDGMAIITADHGNAEQMYDPLTKQPHTAHTSDPVPFIYIGERPVKLVKKDGKLADIAPTMLYLLGLSKPNEMTGETLIQFS